MTKAELIGKLERQLALLRADDEYAIQAFKVLWVDRDIAAVAATIQQRTWSMGWCMMSDACDHPHSHHPYTQGDTVFLLCRPVGRDEEGRKLFLLPDGRVVRYTSEHEQYAHLEFI